MPRYMGASMADQKPSLTAYECSLLHTKSTQNPRSSVFDSLTSARTSYSAATDAESRVNPERQDGLYVFLLLGQP
jgi:hypothetical protein